MTRGNRLDCLRRDDVFAAREHRLVKSSEVVNRPAAVAARTLYRYCFRAVRPRRIRMRSRTLNGTAGMHRRNSNAVLVPSRGRHPDPGIAHPERLEDFLADVLAIRAVVSGYTSHDFCQEIPRRRDVIAGRLPDDPSRLDFHVANPCDEVVPRSSGPWTHLRAKAAGMRQHVANRDDARAL